LGIWLENVLLVVGKSCKVGILVSDPKNKSMIYPFWNNKGGTGKTSLAFQTITEYAIANPGKAILAVDLCPQANLSELMLGGLLGNGANLNGLYTQQTSCSIGRYFQDRFSNPFNTPPINPATDTYPIKKLIKGCRICAGFL
jgi:cellulose biosynthesis protein BcsQ